MTRHVALVALALSLVACGARQKGATLARIDLLPRGTTFVMAIDVTRLKQSPTWTSVGPKLVEVMLGGSQNRTLVALREKCDLDLVRDTRWLLVALGGSGRIDHGVVIVNGAWDRAKAERCATAIDMPRTTSDTTLDDRITEYDHDYFAAWLTSDTLAIAVEDDGLPFLREILAHRSSVMDNPGVARMLANVDPSATMWVAGTMTEHNPLRDPLEDSDIDDKDSHVLAASISTVLGSELTATGVAEFASPSEATSALTRFQKLLGEMRRDVPLLDRAKVTAEGNRLVTRVHLDRTALDVITSMIDARADRQLAYRAEEMAEPPPPAVPEPEAPPPPAPPTIDPAEEARARKQAEAEAEARTAAARAAAEAQAQRAAKDKDDNLRKASARTKTGLAFLDAKIYDKALEEFRAAYTLVPLPQLLYNIAASLDGLKDRQSALDTYKRYLEAEPNGPRAKVTAKRIVELTRDLQKRK